MNYASALIIPLVSVALLFAPDSTTEAGLPGSGLQCDFFKVVRAEYIDLNGNLPHTQTTIHLLNSSIHPVTLGPVYILGPGGAPDIQATYLPTHGMVLPPLGRFDLRINSNIPGVLPATTPLSLGLGNGYPVYAANLKVTSVVAGWVGTSVDQVQLSATIDRNETGDDDNIVRICVEGVPIVL